MWIIQCILYTDNVVQSIHPSSSKILLWSLKETPYPFNSHSSFHPTHFSPWQPPICSWSLWKRSFLSISYKWNHKILWLPLSLIFKFSRITHFVAWITFHLSLLLNNICNLYGYDPFCLSIHQLISSSSVSLFILFSWVTCATLYFY